VVVAAVAAVQAIATVGSMVGKLFGRSQRYLWIWGNELDEWTLIAQGTKPQMADAEAPYKQKGYHTTIQLTDRVPPFGNAENPPSVSATSKKYWGLPLWAWLLAGAGLILVIRKV